MTKSLSRLEKETKRARKAAGKAADRAASAAASLDPRSRQEVEEEARSKKGKKG